MSKISEEVINSLSINLREIIKSISRDNVNIEEIIRTIFITLD